MLSRSRLAAYPQKVFLLVSIALPVIKKIQLLSMTCPICFGSMRHVFSTLVLRRHSADFEVCNTCGYLRVHEPYWLDEAYSSAIAPADTGLVMRNFAIAGKVAAVLYWVFQERGAGRYMDAAGGYGLLTRLMRDFGFEFYWKDKYCLNLVAPGFEYHAALGDCDAVTAMEVLEHVTDPISFVQETLASANTQTLIFTTELYEGDPPQPGSWWYYTFETGQHISFYQRRTLETIGRKIGLNLYSAGGIHILSKAKVDARLLGVVTSRISSMLSPWWTRRVLGSKTITDHESILLKSIEMP